MIAKLIFFLIWKRVTSKFRTLNDIVLVKIAILIWSFKDEQFFSKWVHNLFDHHMPDLLSRIKIWLRSYPSEQNQNYASFACKTIEWHLSRPLLSEQ